MILSLVCALPAAAALPQRAADPAREAPVRDQIRVPVTGAAELRALRHRLSDVDDHWPSRRFGHARAYATDAEQDALDAAGIPYVVEIEDLTAFYAARAAAERGRGGAVGSMGGFRTLAEIRQEMDRLAATYPAICSTRFSVGTTVEGRSIDALRISTTPGMHDPAKPVAWYDAIHHAREPMSGESLLLWADELLSGYGSDPALTRIVETRNVLIIPCVNPDGYEYNRLIAPNGGGMWRKNRRNNGGGDYGVDLNRNYAWEWGSQWPGSSGNPSSNTYRGPAPFSEPETQAMDALVAAQTPGMSVSAHTYSDLMLYSWGYDTIVTVDDPQFRAYGEAFTETSGWPYGTVWQLLYIANGVTTDEHYGRYGTYSFTPEIGSSADGFWPAPSRISALYADVSHSYRMVAQWTGAWAQPGAPQWTEVAGDGDAWREPGETWQLALPVDNPGVAALSGTLDLASQSAFVTVTGGAQALQAPAQGGTVSAPWTVDFAANAPTGAPLALDVVFDYDGWQDAVPLEVVLGQQRVLLHDDMEDHDHGWTTNNATNWSWERAVPQATSSGGSTVQPGQDNPAGQGTRCRVTGAAAGSSAGTNDVDGTAVLTSPVFDLSEHAQATLVYARWFANLPGSALDDEWVAEVSNDGGGSWTLLERVGNDPSWRTVEFALHSVLPLTDAMRLRFTVADDPNNDLTEGLLDDVEVRTVSTTPTLGLWGEAAAGETVTFFVDGAPGADFDVAWSAVRTQGTTVPGIAGTLYLQTPVPVLAGTCDADGLGRISVTLPGAVSGRTLHLQGVVGLGTPDAEFSTALTVAFP